jgi:hypothetical protein
VDQFALTPLDQMDLDQSGLIGAEEVKFIHQDKAAKNGQIGAPRFLGIVTVTIRSKLSGD